MRIPYGRQTITPEDIQAVSDVLNSDFLTTGPKNFEFEEKFAKYIGSQYAVSVANGTAALHLCAMALGVKQGQKFITTPITFVASANCIEYCGGEIVFADINPDTYLLDINKVEELINNNPPGTFSGIIPVDFAGQPVNLEEFRNLADKHGLWIIEDACHAPGAFFTDSKGEKQNCGNGKFADLSIFSFHPVKHIACGEGGMVTTNNEELKRKVKILRSHGTTKEESLFVNSLKESEGRDNTKSVNYPGWYYEMQELGYNYRLTDFQAALGISQLTRAEKGLRRREEIAAKYDEAFVEKDIITPVRIKNSRHAWHLYVIQVDNRREFYDHLVANGIFAQIHYIPVHLQPFYKNRGWKNGDFPVAEKYYEKCISLPMYPGLSNEQQEYVINKVLEFLK
ncbi:MAG: UDP-4-amino-4,6-dideoxy-N-acetyl-beta-L-altrosamine transaminase [Bacteroidales bacterium]|nr:UDP-4-amino-4,6-dideoxy-N-acetyl-beta-L-altrosamine transaminase [Bacteroidales bacterium]